MSFWHLSNELKNSAKEPKINTLILCIRQKFNNTLWLKICYFAVHVTLCSRLHLLVKVVGIYVKTYLHTILNLHLIDFQTSIKFVWNIKMTYFLPYQPKKWAIFHEKKSFYGDDLGLCLKYNSLGSWISHPFRSPFRSIFTPMMIRFFTLQYSMIVVHFPVFDFIAWQS